MWTASRFETSRSGFYAGGDVITGASNMSNAMSGGKQAARKIDERLMGEHRRWEQLFPEFEYSHQAPGEPSLSRRPCRPFAARRTPASARRRKSSSDSAPQEALEECRRCLRCDLRGPGAG